MSDKYLKLNDVKDIINNYFLFDQHAIDIIYLLENLPTHQDRLEVIKEYCGKQKMCKKCIFAHKGLFSLCELDKNPEYYKIKEIDEAIAKIKEIK
jgi:hypothetical protein